MQGSYVALITPFTREGVIDFDAVNQLIEWHISEGTDGVVILGTTGECASIHSEERTQFIAHCVGRVQGRMHVMVGTGSRAGLGVLPDVDRRRIYSLS